MASTGLHNQQQSEVTLVFVFKQVFVCFDAVEVNGFLEARDSLNLCDFVLIKAVDFIY